MPMSSSDSHFAQEPERVTVYIDNCLHRVGRMFTENGTRRGLWIACLAWTSWNGGTEGRRDEKTEEGYERMRATRGTLA